MGLALAAAGASRRVGQDVITSMNRATSIRKRNNVAEYGTGQPVLLAHGFGTDNTVWAQQVLSLQGRCRVITFDHVGCGHSDLSCYSPRRYSTLHGYAHDLVEICRECEVSGVTVVAHSASGMIAMLASLMAPDLFDRLVLLGASARYLDDEGYRGGMSQEEVEQLLQLAGSNFGQWVAGFAPLMIGVDRPELVRYLSGMIENMRPDIALAFLRVMLRSDYREEFARVQHPTWLLQTQNDRAVPQQAADFLHQTIGGSRYLSLPVDGHLPHISAPEVVNQALWQIFEER